MKQVIISQIEKMPGVKTVGLLTPGSNQALVTFEPSDYRELIEKAAGEGKLLEMSPKDQEEWTFANTGRSQELNWEHYDFRIADITDSWLGTVANMDASLANRIQKWFNDSITYEEF